MWQSCSDHRHTLHLCHSRYATRIKLSANANTLVNFWTLQSKKGQICILATQRQYNVFPEYFSFQLIEVWIFLILSLFVEQTLKSKHMANINTENFTKIKIFTSINFCVGHVFLLINWNSKYWMGIVNCK